MSDFPGIMELLSNIYLNYFRPEIVKSNSLLTTICTIYCIWVFLASLKQI